MKNLLPFGLSIAFLLVVFAINAQITGPIAFNCQKDAHVDNKFPTSNFGTSSSFTIKVSTSSFFSRAFIQFDLSSIPSNAVITQADLRLRIVGSEGSDITNSSFIISRANATWDESLINFSNQPTVETSDEITTSSLFSTTHRAFDVKNHVQKMVKGSVSNHGWMIRRNNESTVTIGSSYNAKEILNSNIPQLIVSYYVPYQITNATIVHATNSSTNNGSISPVIQFGPGSNTYKWYKNGTLISGQTNLNISGIGYGWYGLEVSGALGVKYYYSFLVGVKCGSVQITYSPGPNYIDDAIIYNLNSFGTDYGIQNFGTTTVIRSETWTSGSWYNMKSPIRFRLWVDPNLEVNGADLTLFGVAGRHNPLNRSNESEMERITSNWEEMTITYNNAPPVSNDVNVIVPPTTSSTEDKVIDVKSFFNHWKLDNLLNYGMMFQLTSYVNSYTRMEFHSSDVVDVSKHPSITFTLFKECDFESHSLLKRNLDGAISPVYNGKLNFAFDEEYNSAPNQYIPFKIYSPQGQLVAHVTINGSVLVGGTNITPILFDSGKMVKTLNLSNLGLSANGHYILEVSLLNGDKRFLKFIYKN